MLQPNQLTFAYDKYSYTVYYRGRSLGGAGTLRREPKHWRHQQADLKMYQEAAEREVAQLKVGGGQLRMREWIEKIDKEMPDGPQSA